MKPSIGAALSDKVARRFLSLAAGSGFGGRAYAEPLKKSMYAEAYEKFTRDAASLNARETGFLKSLAADAVAELASRYPNVGIVHKIVHDALWIGGMQVFTGGKVSPLTVEIRGELSGDAFPSQSDRPAFFLRMEHPVEGNALGVEIGRMSRFWAYFALSGEKSFTTIPSAREIAGWMEAGMLRNRETAERLEPEKFTENTLDAEQVFDFLERQRSWMDFSVVGDTVMGTTRTHGSVGDEMAGNEDIAEAKRLGRLVKQEFGNKVKVKVETVDEWTELEVSVPGRVGVR